jgi:hypothetical protein
VLVRVPGKGFHSRLVARELADRVRFILEAPDAEFVVVASRGQLLLIRRPFEPTYLLFVMLKLREILIVFPGVSLEDIFVSGS